MQSTSRDCSIQSGFLYPVRFSLSSSVCHPVRFSPSYSEPVYVETRRWRYQVCPGNERKQANQNPELDMHLARNVQNHWFTAADWPYSPLLGPTLLRSIRFINRDPSGCSSVLLPLDSTLVN